jgi:hypothetical protein
MHQIRLNCFEKFTELMGEAGDVIFSQLVFGAAPLNDLYAAGCSVIPRFQAQHKPLVPAFRQGCQKPLIVHRIGTREIQNAHQFLSKLCPA